MNTRSVVAALQLAALVCLMLAQSLSQDLRETLSVAGVLLFVHALVVASVARVWRLQTRKTSPTEHPRTTTQGTVKTP